MSDCKHCGHLEAEEPRTCPTCGSVMIWAKAQFGGLWGGYRRQAALKQGLWDWRCSHGEQRWHQDAEQLVQWAEKCPDRNTANFAIAEAKSMRPEDFDRD